MKYQAWTYESKKDCQNNWVITEINKGASLISVKKEFKQVLQMLGFNPEFVSMDPDFPNCNTWELMLNDGQPVGRIVEIYN